MWMIELFKSGGFIMYPLLLASIVSWAVALERAWRFRQLALNGDRVHLEIQNAVLRSDWKTLRSVCVREGNYPISQIALAALDRIESDDSRLKKRWAEALERRRQLAVQDLRRGLWVLGTIGSAAPFVGLFGTVVGILKSFQDMAAQGGGGFTVVAAGISEALVATAAGIVVAVLAVMVFNTFQTFLAQLNLKLRMQAEELTEAFEESV